MVAMSTPTEPSGPGRGIYDRRRQREVEQHMVAAAGDVDPNTQHEM